MSYISLLSVMITSIFLSLPASVGIPLFFFVVICISVLPAGLIGTTIGYHFLLPKDLKNKKRFFKIFLIGFILNSIVWCGYMFSIFPLLKAKYLTLDYNGLLWMQPVFIMTAVLISYRNKK